MASIAGDELPPSGALVSVYESLAIRRLIQNVVFGDENSPIHLSSDPLGRCSVNVFKEGWKHSYHFDESEFSTTLMLQKPKAGGIFEYTPRLRKSQDEYAYDVVEDVINNEDTDYTSLKEDNMVSALQVRLDEGRLERSDSILPVRTLQLVSPLLAIPPNTITNSALLVASLVAV